MISVTSILSDDSITVSPNPFSEKINIEFNNPAESKASIFLFDLNGNWIYHSDKKTTDESMEVNLEDYPPGIYLIRFELGEKNYTRKVTKRYEEI